MSLPFKGDHGLPGFNFSVEEWSATGLTYETLAIAARSPRRASLSQLQSPSSPPAGS
jgi:hypothetical protein